MSRLHRRAVLALPAIAALPRPGTAQHGMGHPAAQQPGTGESFAEAERAILAGRTPVAGGIAIDMATLSENGNSVDIGVKVDSPWNEEDHVTAIHILAEKNPFPRVATFHLSRRAGRAEVATRLRLATSQTILVLAETSRGRVHRAGQEVIVILGACVETG
jgi:sulfur-oxidizing protein SoxY